MKSHFQFFALVLVSLTLLVSACGPAPNPKLQGNSAEPQEREQAPAPPAVAERPAPPPSAPVEAPRPQVAASPKPQPQRQPAAKQVPARQPVTSRPADAGTPTSTPRQDTASSDPRGLTLPAPEQPPLAVPLPPPDEVKQQPIEPPPPRHIRVPSGTLVAVRMIDSVDSETSRVGETFKASLDEPIVIDNETVFQKGAEVYVKLSKVQSAGRVSGRSELQLQLDRIFLGRKSYLLESNTYTNTGASQGARTAKTAGLGAAIGAAIGAISGGGKGAVIGGATGAGAGAGVEAIRKGEQVRVDSEARLEFKLEESVEVTQESPSSPPQRNNPSGPNRFGTRP